MNTPHNPADAPVPASAYSQGVEYPAAARVLNVSGQIGVTAKGHVGVDAAEQARITFDNLRAVLRAAGMDVADLVQLRSYLVDADDLAAFRQARDAFLGGARPASTLVIVKALANPAWRVEVEAVAAK